MGVEVRKQKDNGRSSLKHGEDLSRRQDAASAVSLPTWLPHAAASSSLPSHVRQRGVRLPRQCGRAWKSGGGALGGGGALARWRRKLFPAPRSAPTGRAESLRDIRTRCNSGPGRPGGRAGRFASLAVRLADRHVRYRESGFTRAITRLIHGVTRLSPTITRRRAASLGCCHHSPGITRPASLACRGLTRTGGRVMAGE